MMAKIRVLIADDHAVFRAGLELLINSQADMEVVAQAADSYETARKTHETRPDVLIMDLVMPGGNAIRTIERLRHECTQTRVLVLTGQDEQAYLPTVLAAGGSGYLVKMAEATEVLSAIRAVHEGRLFVDLKLQAPAAQSLLGSAGTGGAPHPDTSLTSLSQRQRQVLTKLAQGYTNQQIADQLFLSVKTVETYRARIAEKLNLRSRADLFRYASAMDLLGPDKSAPEA
jgi:DNA-binding NarL/FixJ family response regulator